MALPVARKPTNGYQAAAIQGVARRKIPSAKIAASELGSLASSTIGGVIARRQEFLSARVDRRHREPYVSFFGPPMLQATLGSKANSGRQLAARRAEAWASRKETSSRFVSSQSASRTVLTLSPNVTRPTL